MPILINRSRRKKTYKESDLVRDCLEYLRLRNYFAIRVNSGLVMLKDGNGKVRAVKLADRGTPDIVALSPNGKYVAIECKVGKNNLTEPQRWCLDQVRNRKGIACVVRSLSDLEQYLSDGVCHEGWVKNCI